MQGVQVRTITNIEPLEPQLGVFSKETAPAAIQEILFGGQKPTASEIAEAGDDPDAVPSLRVYAVLDAARLKHLPELLESSGLNYRCLFKGDAYDELNEVAPWVVELEENVKFTRNLFTLSDNPWHLWDKGACIFLRFKGTCDEICHHLRHFTRLPDSAGKWYYLRLAEANFVSAILRSPDNSLSARFLNPLHDVMVLQAGQKSMLHFKQEQPGRARYNGNTAIDQEFLDILSVIQAEQFDEKLRLYLIHRSDAFAKLPLDQQKSWIQQAVIMADKFGIRIAAALADFVTIHVHVPHGYLTTGSVQAIMESGRHEIDRVRDLARHLKVKL